MKKREIKFRAWDKSKSYFINFGNEYWFNDEENTITFQCTDVIGDHDDGTRFILMQYTGLKDKNGKEIYEGDIVKDWASVPCIVEWRKSGWIVRQPNTNPIYIRSILEPAEIIVIGNIYENPELLK